MNFVIISHVLHKSCNDSLYAYAPYVQEMNLWLKHVDCVTVVAPLTKENEMSAIEMPYEHKHINTHAIPSIQFTSIVTSITSLFKLPIILYAIFKACKKGDHIHLRCPGNIGLLGCLVQICFPKKSKTAKYAGNWDPKSKQPWSYRFQKWLLNNVFLTKNMKVLVYGRWNGTSKNIVPFFTASYLESEKMEVPIKYLDGKINVLFVGTLSIGKQPLLTVQAVKKLLDLEYKVHLDIYGEGQQRQSIEDYISENNLSSHITLHGNKDKATLKKAYLNAHFLIFMSRSEGWPKAIAEAMFWKCLPISTKVSCVPEMLDYGNRGSIVSPNIESIIKEFECYFNNREVYTDKVEKAYLWSRRYTLDKFEAEIPKLLKSS
ncbi:glycosyltransferase family 4 protein [Pontimicrobium aquaticum]|uniref:Glycosyltransferase n=1 Tax=Pontimicrobium aquaticum TaxID=2565367 RepID=A0A4V5LPW0_9FLAO|nr:glycosyltransferase [Pontimicrobium aquaticum]TJY32909.1 glycosyltransferase [Pontimicrobium aquaticum]